MFHFEGSSNTDEFQHCFLVWVCQHTLYPRQVRRDASLGSERPLMSSDDVFQEKSTRYRAVEPSSGSNVIPRRARSGLAGLRPHTSPLTSQEILPINMAEMSVKICLFTEKFLPRQSLGRGCQKSILSAGQREFPPSHTHPHTLSHTLSLPYQCRWVAARAQQAGQQERRPAHRLLYHSTLGLRIIKKKIRNTPLPASG